MDDEVGADLLGVGVAEGDHLGELVAGVDVEEGKRDLAGVEGLLGEAEHDGRVFADRVEHDGVGKFSDGLAEDGDGFGFEGLEVIEAKGRAGWGVEDGCGRVGQGGLPLIFREEDGMC